MLGKVIDAMTAPRRMREPGSGSTTGRFDWRHRRGLAFAELLEHLPTDHLHPKTAATVVVTIDHTVLAGALKAAHLDTDQTLSAGEARRLACNAGILPAVLGAKSVALDLGRESRLFSESQRVAKGLEHATCAATGCERPYAWCELHHRQPWARGGTHRPRRRDPAVPSAPPLDPRHRLQPPDHARRQHPIQQTHVRSTMLSVSAVTLGSMNIVLPLLTLVIGALLGAVTVLVWSRRAGDPDVLRALSARGDDQAVLRDGLERLHERLMDVEQQRASWQGQLRQQVDDMRHSTDLLRRETGALSTALRKPHVRGQWGELHLRRAVELAGMVEHCDFQEQVHLAHEDGNLRPDVVVRLAGGRSVVVDAKVPLDAHLDALATDDPEEAAAHLRRHVRQVRSHVDALSGKAYWRSMPGAPEFVVMFVPAESFLAAALDTDPTLLSYAATRDVVIATPTTLIALLRTIAHGWTTEALAERTREIHELGRELHTRIGVMGGHLDKVGRSLKGAVEAFNSAVGSIESRVLVTARQFEDIGVTREELAPVEPVTQVPRPLTAAELLDAVAEERLELPATPTDTAPGDTGPGESRRSSA